MDLYAKLLIISDWYEKGKFNIDCKFMVKGVLSQTTFGQN